LFHADYLAAGAGKTTLMDALAGRKTTGRVEGQVWVDDHPKEQHTFARVCGYVEQTDVHTARVRACLQLSTWQPLCVAAS
jgi:ABC-type multidrug transport system ATPase subunit